MNRRYLLMVPLILVALTQIQTAAAVFQYTVDYDVKPGEGPYDQQILFMVRCYPIIDTHQMWRYTFWDGMPVEIRIASTAYSKTQYNHYYDIRITPPEGYNEVGEHRIDVWLEDYNGSIKKLHYTYEITDGPLTTVEAWSQYIKKHPEILAEIKGPKGDPGVAGPQGAKGAKGDTGDRGDVGPPGDMGPMGLQGPVGVQGPQGEPASPVSVIVGSIVSVIFSVAFTYYWCSMRKEEGV